MFDFDDVEEAEASGGGILSPEGEDVPLPVLPGFTPASKSGGYGRDGRLKLLCLHGGSVNDKMMELQMRMLWNPAKELLELIECEYPVAPNELLLESMPPAAREAAEQTMQFLPEGSRRMYQWYGKAPLASPDEQWTSLEESIEFLVSHIQRNGPYDGIVGFSQGGEIGAQMCRLAEQGDPRLQGKFKFFMAMAHRWPKPFNRPEFRPVAPIRIPSLHLQEVNAAAGGYPPADYEDLVLHWDESCRAVAWHTQGHKPPRLAGADLEKLRHFIQSFHRGEPWRPTPDADDYLRGIVLPFPRRTAAVPAPPSPSKPLRVLCFHGSRPGIETVEALQSMVTALKNEGLAAQVAIEREDLASLGSAEFSALAPGPQPPSVQTRPDQSLSPEAWTAAGVLAEKAVARAAEESPFSEENPIGFIGIGSGAVVALRAAAEVRRRGGLAWRLYAVDPPSLFTVPEVGGLRGCEVVCVIPREDTAGERWRFSAATHGPYRVLVTVPDNPWAKQVVEDLQSAFQGS